MCACLLVCICAMYMQCSHQPEGISSPGTRVIGRRQLPDVSAILNWSPLQEQEVLWAHSLVLISCLCHLLTLRKVMYTLGKSLILFGILFFCLKSLLRLGLVIYPRLVSNSLILVSASWVLGITVVCHYALLSLALFICSDSPIVF